MSYTSRSSFFIFSTSFFSLFFFFFSSRRRHTRLTCDWSSDVCSSDLFVHVTYEHHTSLAATRAAIWRRFVQPDVDFMDGMLHAPDRHVVALGEFVDAAPYVNRYDWLGVYHRSMAERDEDYLRTRDYYFRYDSGVTNVHPSSALGRLLLGKFLDSDRLLRLAEHLRRFREAERPDVTVDLLVPFSQLEPFLAWYDRRIAH